MAFNGFVSAGVLPRLNTTSVAPREHVNPGRGTKPRTHGRRNGHHSERLAERTRIARELHDTLLQGFTAAHLQLQLAVGELPPDSPAKPRFSGLILLMSRVLQQGRLAIQGLRSPNEQALSLGQAIASVPDELGLEASVQFRVVVEGTQRELKPSLSCEVYRVVREAIVNAYRHSGAKNIEAEIEYRPSELRVAVRDNGCGIDPEELQSRANGHLGLQGMRERSERIGARLRVWSRSARGTEIELRIPGSVAFEQSGPMA
jgi:signal transduction histidine kinase